MDGDGFDKEILADYFHSARTTVEKIEDQYFLKIEGARWTGDDGNEDDLDSTIPERPSETARCRSVLYRERVTEIARFHGVAIFLASPASKLINGVTFPVDGGGMANS